MPPTRRSHLGRRSAGARAVSTHRANMSQEDRNIAQQRRNANHVQIRAQQTEEQQQAVIDSRRLAQQSRRVNQCENFLVQSRRINTENRQQRRSAGNANLLRVAFRYDCAFNYRSLPVVQIGSMVVVCPHCNALKFPGETPGLCCLSGKVKLPTLPSPQEPLRSYLEGVTAESKQFLANVQNYNGCFQMTSFAASIINESGYNPSFKVIPARKSTLPFPLNDRILLILNSSLGNQIQGQVHHRAGSLLPLPNGEYNFLQIYFIGNESDQINRRSALYNRTKEDIIRELQRMLHDHNELIGLFKNALDRMLTDDHQIVIKADKRPNLAHERQYNAPTIDEVAIIVVGEQVVSRDIVLTRRNNGQLQRISETHRSYDALQYPLMFWTGDDGYHFNIKMLNPVTGEETTKKVSSMNYYAYRLMIRQNEDNYLLRFRRLLQQFCVDMYVKIETERLSYIRLNQAKLRSEEYIHLRDAIRTEGDARNLGRLTILPATYVGSPRHMHEYAQDAMAFVRQYGRPDLFVTFTCNSRWIDIQCNLIPGQTSSDRHDITARVFRQKLKVLMGFITKQRVFGDVRCWMYSVEWQKRGLPHAHILLWFVEKIRPDEIDAVICAEIPDPEIDQELYDIVIKNMIHGPCGNNNMDSPCMANGKCSKRYPRPLTAETITGDDGYPLYRRRSPDDNGRTVTLKVKQNDVVVDNSWIVPYSPLLCKTFDAHINVEDCNSIKAIKYVCKYITKGSDMAAFGVPDPNADDEVTRYQIGRYVSCNEALWRIFSFPIHDRHPTVVHLAVHLENGQRVYFTEHTAIQRAERPPATTLTSFFSTCESDPFARTLLYSQMPRYYTWNASSKKFQRRKQGERVPDNPDVFSTDAIGRIYTVHPSRNAECFYLRLLLVNVRGPTSFESLRTVDGVLCPTYRDACQRLQLLENDTHWDMTLADAIMCAPANQIRSLFAIIISTCNPSNPKDLWDKYKDNMSEDFLHRVRAATGDFNLGMTDEIHNESLIAIEDICLLISGNLLCTLGIPAPNRSIHDAFNQEIEREREYDRDALSRMVCDNVPLLNPEQKIVYETLMKAIDNGNGGIFFIDAPGGTGKTFLISLLLATIRSRSQIALAVASSGIAATLLEGGRTAHSALKLPLNLQVVEEPTCNISRNSAMGKVLQCCKIIIWDECTMVHKRALEAVNRTMKDLRNNSRRFGGAMILLSGDFRQTLPVIPKSTAADAVNASLKSSSLWRFVKKLKLNTNMRVSLQNDPTADVFSKQLIAIGNGEVPVDVTTGLISFPSNFCNFVTSKDELIRKVFPDIVVNYLNHDWLSERAILAAKNKDVNEINFKIQNQIGGPMHSFKSVDCVVNEDEATNYPTEFLNSLDLPGVPQHILHLKVGSVVIMLRNLQPPKLCNGTRLIVKQIMNNIIYATILKGKFKGEQVLIPRIPLIPTDMPFEFKRIQFPVRLAFAMTINKAQGQSLDVCGLNLENECFSHGQLYVACSRVGKPSALFVLAPEQKTKNIVYHKVLE
ncbi:uncharacterized protein LOC122403185 [Colletes gigas]|uniref:uncharacterized protein LOC122401347 n=1 Tax=Colletes gigas TaxID=935657 RepID=UPI001C9B3A8C|nr:uncharacterized protein LOC122401347 [Colletes gigas]XP_043262482.1 uncharacterized protein LOC122403185 [Colletes gigas]